MRATIDDAMSVAFTPDSPLEFHKAWAAEKHKSPEICWVELKATGEARDILCEDIPKDAPIIEHT